MKDKVSTENIISALGIALRSSLARWWAIHKGALYSWDEFNITIKYCFLPPS